MISQYPVSVKAVTHGPQHHFFGYYEKTPWNLSGEFMLGLETGFVTRLPEADDKATLGLIELNNGNKFRPLAETNAWNMQQGCMLQWLPTDPERKIIYNDREGDQFISVVMDIHTGEKRTLPLPVYSVSRSGQFAVSLNFSRLRRWRPVTGYAGRQDPIAEKLCPPDDGIYWMDLTTGANRLALSLEQISEFEHKSSMEGVEHWVEHLVLNTNDTRFFFIHRWRPQGEAMWLTRLLSAKPDGTDLRCVTDHDYASHMDWKNEDEILVWANRDGIGNRFYLINDRTSEIEIFGEDVLTKDGHCSYSPNREWLLVDMKNGDVHIRVLLIRVADGHRYDIGNFYSPPELRGDVRCDLHPRWNRDGSQVCIDSAHEGTRQIYVLDVAELTSSERSSNSNGTT